MKTLPSLLVVAAMFIATPFAEAVTYLGSWKNTTFGSTGALTIEFNKTNSKITGVFDIDGNVFGGADPPAIPFNMTLNSSGNGTVKVTGTGVGTVQATYTKGGKVTMKITNIPGGFLTEARINAKIDLAIEKMTATCEIDNASGLYAEATAEAHVHKAAKIKVDRKVNVSGKSGKVTAKVITNTGIKSFKATVAPPAKVRVTGNNPYEVNVSKLPIGTTKVTLTVINADNFKTTKVVKFVRAASSASLLQLLSPD